MKTKVAALFLVGLATWWSTGLAQTESPLTPEPAAPNLAAETSASSDAYASEVLPLLMFDEARLTDAIKTMARQTGLNVQFDPRITEGIPGEEGEPIGNRNISIRFENVTAREAMDAVLTNYGLELLPDKSGIGRVTLKDPEAPEPLITRIIQLRNSNPTNMVALIQPTLSTRSQVLADVRTSQMIVMTTEAEHESLLTLIDQLDRQTKQVLIEAHLVETLKNPTSIKGIDWSGTLADQNVRFGNGVTAATSTTTEPGGTTTSTLPSGRTVTSTSPSSTTKSRTSVFDPVSGLVGLSANTSSGFSPNTAFLDADGVSAALSFLNTDTDSEVISTPRTVTLDNETATIDVTDAFPIFEITPGSQASPAGATITYTNLGTILRVTPRISAEDKVNLKVEPEVSDRSGQDEQFIAGTRNVANIYTIRRMSTRVVIPSGNTLVMGGLATDNKSKEYIKVPILGDLPGIGLLFRKESKVRRKRNLIIFITPTIVADGDFRPAKSDFLSIPKAEPSNEEPSALDTGKPYDWKQPVQ